MEKVIFIGAGTVIDFTSLGTLRTTLGKYKARNGVPDTPGIYTTPCKNFPKFYIDETGTTFERKVNKD